MRLKIVDDNGRELKSKNATIGENDILILTNPTDENGKNLYPNEFLRKLFDILEEAIEGKRNFAVLPDKIGYKVLRVEKEDD